MRAHPGGRLFPTCAVRPRHQEKPRQPEIIFAPDCCFLLAQGVARSTMDQVNRGNSAFREARVSRRNSQGDAEMSATVRLDFGNLPLMEAVVRASFASPIQLTFSRINEAHEALKSEFPQISEPGRYEVAPGVTESASFSPGQITGVVYTGNREGLIVTVQSRVAIARWVRQIAQDAPSYPRFGALQNALWSTVDALKEACVLEALPITVVNMSYVNFIHVADSSRVLKTYFCDRAHVAAADGAEEIHKLEASWRESGIDLRFSLEKVSATMGEQTMEGYRLTTAAGTHVRGPNDDRSDLQRVHDRLQFFFRDLISEQAKEEWQLVEVPDG